MEEKTLIRVGIVYDHSLVCTALRYMVEGFSSTSDQFVYEVVVEAGNSDEFFKKLPRQKPDVVLIHVGMPHGFEITRRLTDVNGYAKVLALSTSDADSVIIRTLKSGATGYLSKHSKPEELLEAINALYAKGYYYSDAVTRKMAQLLAQENKIKQEVQVLSERELQFIQLSATEWTYKEIADQMYLSPRTVEGYRDALFEKLNVNSRVGLVVYAIRNGILTIDDPKKESEADNNKSVKLKQVYVNR